MNDSQASGADFTLTLVQRSAFIEDIPVPLGYVSPTQINVQVPFKVPLGNLMRTLTEKMGVRVDDRFYGGAHTGVIRELS